MQHDAYDEEEFWSRDQIEATQLARLKNVVARVYKGCEFYRKRLDEAGVTPDSIKTLDDIEKILMTSKDDLRSQYPLGLVIVPRNQLVRLHCSSGTTGTPVAIAHTQNDLNVWADLMARCLHMVGVRKDDVFQNMSGYGLFTGGLGLHDAATELGCTVVPASGGSTRRQTVLIRDLGATVLACTPSYALHLYEVGLENGIDFKKLPLRVGIFGGEPWSKAMRQEMEENMGIDTHNIYGLSEIMGPGVAIDCSEHNGLHLWEDHFIAEIVDPATGEPVPEGELGELVLTNLTKEGSPLIRYRTRDLTSIDTRPCKCGRTHARLQRFAGRSDDMLIIRGVNVFPQQIENLILKTDGLSPNYQLVVEREGSLDTMEVQVEVNESIFHDQIGKLQEIQAKLKSQIKDFFGVTTKVRLMEPHSIERSKGKATRVIDKRDLKNSL